MRTLQQRPRIPDFHQPLPGTSSRHEMPDVVDQTLQRTPLPTTLQSTPLPAPPAADVHEDIYENPGQLQSAAVVGYSLGQTGTTPQHAAARAGYSRVSLECQDPQPDATSQHAAARAGYSRVSLECQDPQPESDYSDSVKYYVLDQHTQPPYANSD